MVVGSAGGAAGAGAGAGGGGGDAAVLVAAAVQGGVVGRRAAVVRRWWGAGLRRHFCRFRNCFATSRYFSAVLLSELPGCKPTITVPPFKVCCAEVTTASPAWSWT